MFYRNTRINLPQLDVKVKKDVLDESIENCDKQARQRMKSYADQRRRAKNTTMQIGDCISQTEEKQQACNSL